VMGDAAFFAALKRYVADNLNRTVTTSDFQRAAEGSYGRSLDWFFSEWVYHGGAPHYTVTGLTATRRGAGYRVELDLRQQQDSGVFRMPLDLSLKTASGSIGVVAWDSLRVQHVTLSAPDSVTAVIVDPDAWVVAAQ
jgi:aminopeptidase N